MAYRLFTQGERVRVLNDVDLRPHTIVKAGECGQIVSADPDLVEVLLDTYHHGLAEYRNIMWLCPAYLELSRYLLKLYVSC